MEWQLTWGEREDGLLAVEKQTGKTPDALVNKPRLYVWVEGFYEAFWMLDAGRPVYQGSVGRIPLSEMAAYMSIFKVGGVESKKLFIRMMKALDSVYMRIINERIKRDIDIQRRKAEEDRVNGR